MDDKYGELMELMKIPEIEKIMLAKLEQAKLIFKDEIRHNFREKRRNIIDFPGKKEKVNPVRRVELGNSAVLIDTTNVKQLTTREKLELFNDTFARDAKARELIMEFFFVKVLPFLERSATENQ